MVRWLGQRDSFRCGPIAVLNIMKWAGIKTFLGRRVTEKLAKGLLTTLTKTDLEGTWAKDLVEVVRNIPGIHISNGKRPTRRYIKKQLDKGKIVLLDAPWFDKKTRKHVPHFSLIVDKTPSGAYYKVVNHYDGVSSCWIPAKDLANLLRKKDATIYIVSKDKDEDDE
ncbi:MAG: hypothetical protein DRN26_00085 [Thermoplasmata archaeon]|nr:MAG: hypothetical protein DRN26_00085 [Thermoplasmata archaeon]